MASNFTVAGITVSRAAMDQHMIAQMQPDVIIVEEAAEVLEADMLGALLVGA